jgi:diguanylate cyclase (GGDEF)-like protein
MADPRILQYREALVAMRTGSYEIDIPLGPDDEVAELGRELKDLSSSLKRRLGETEKLSKITEKVNAGLVLDEVLNFVYDSFRSLIPYDRIGLALIERRGKIVRARWARSQALDIKIPQGYWVPLKGSTLANIIDTGEPRILNDLEAYLAEHPNSDSTRRVVEEGMRSSLTCPLIAKGRPTGFIFFSSMERNAYCEDHQDLFRRIAGQLSIIVEKSRLYEQLVHLNKELVVARNALAQQATHDPLTGIWNRRALLQILEKEVSLAHRESKPMCVVMADVDHFKDINDEYGHQAGDEVLSAVAHRLSCSLRSSETVGRYGGEEFLVILYPCDESVSLNVMERLRSTVSVGAIETELGDIQTTLSLGGAVSNGHQMVDKNMFIRVADEALYRAKQNGRNRSELAMVP